MFGGISKQDMEDAGILQFFLFAYLTFYSVGLY
jgi:hypothetical protein